MRTLRIFSFVRIFIPLRFQSCCFHGNKQTIKYAAELIKKSTGNKVVVLTGAGISTPSGIPDFRSPVIGLYDNLGEYGLNQATDIFDLSFFIHNPKPFFKLAKELYPGQYKPNIIHFFMRCLVEENKLLRVYTQNIDSLEKLSGIPEEKIVFAHGTFDTATCMKCKQKYDGDNIKRDVMDDIIPICRNDWCNGVIKPDVVFFGEDLPQRFFTFHQDLSDCNLMLILGTSLEVYPVAGLVDVLPKGVPRILFNLTVPEQFHESMLRQRDAVYQGDLMNGMKELANELQWTNKINNFMENL